MDKLFERFTEYLINHCNVSAKEKMLLAVSGGVDSVVMMHLFHRAGFSCEVAHCNFQLRGNDSEDDEAFVRTLATQLNFPFHSTRFFTEEYAVGNGVSIQMAARQLRYEWFEQLLEERDISCVATAHHANDVAETMLLNLTKGTGLAGMHGIHAVNGNVIRPLLFASKRELENYAAHNNLSWRTDTSNLEVYYQRNKIRHEVLPLLEAINPELTDAFTRHARLVSQYELLLEDYIRQQESQMVTPAYDGRIFTIQLDKLLASPAPAVLLYHFLKPCNAGSVLCETILATGTVGAEFYSNSHKIVRDRDVISVFHPDCFMAPEFEININDKHLLLPYGRLDVDTVETGGHIQLDKLPGFAAQGIAYLDADTMKFPLVVRKWRKGDAFHPLGMQGRKLLSDFFIDAKFSSAMKEVVYLLMTGDEVAWVIGHRIDDRFKLKDTTKKSLRLRYISNDNTR